MTQPVLYCAELLYTGMGGAQAPGGVVVVGSTVAATGHPDTLRRQYPQAREEAAGIIAPLPVNAHTHLDMSTYTFKPLPYFQWIPEVVIPQQSLRTPQAAQAGAALVHKYGTAAVGDIVWSPAIMETLLQSDLQGTLYFEVIGPFPEQANERFAAVRAQLERWRAMERPGLRVGLSPHTPFNVSHRLMRLVAEYAQGKAFPSRFMWLNTQLKLSFSGLGAAPCGRTACRSFIQSGLQKSLAVSQQQT
ncbi:hypothetical protein ACFP81_11395 [Deinococcus lacus]|uniref:Aminodeoxyfutalosine deaminase/Imidazolonepropionase-like composite domain-containing protein n=1 Tax=Deinococcus lacus TaxID=392561 RepID=A0ABW1YGH3_9DEIO